MIKPICFILSLVSFIPSFAADGFLKGKVTSEGKAMAEVVISDGFSCVTTDAKGRYAIEPDQLASFITVSTPAGYLPQTDSLNRPIFFIPIDENRTDYNFELLKNPKDDRRHAFMTQSDIQVVAEDELCLYDGQINEAREYFKQFDDRDVFGIDCGDVVGEHPELYHSSLVHRAAFGHPIYITNGNHDKLYGVRTQEHSKSRFEKAIGPTNYSFNRGDVHYIALDNVFYIGCEYFYMGYVDENTFRWLEQDLSFVPEGSTVVMFMHIPLGFAPVKPAFNYSSTHVSKQTVNADHLIELMKPYNTHFITGHMHTTHNVEYSDRAYEHNTPGSCGMWWDIDFCADGTPQGYGVYEVDGSDINWHFKSKGHDRDYQMRLYPAGADTKYPDEFIANIWNADSKWTVEWLEDGKVMGVMTQYEGKDPMTVERTADRSKLRYSWICAHDTSHLYRATPKNPNAKISVRATDRFCRVYQSDLN